MYGLDSRLLLSVEVSLKTARHLVCAVHDSSKAVRVLGLESELIFQDCIGQLSRDADWGSELCPSLNCDF